MYRQSVATLALVLVTCALWSDDDLAALARKEKERRAKIVKPAKVLNEADGKNANGSALTLVTAPAGAPAATAASTTGSASDQGRAQWKAGWEQVRGNLARAEEAQKSLEGQIETLRADMAPLSGAEAQDPMRLQKRDSQIAQMVAQLPAAKAAVATAKKAVTDFEDEARKSSIPPGWLR